MYTRQTVLENLPPFEVEDYGSSVERIVGYYTGGEGREEIGEQFQLKTMIRRLEEKPSGYDVAFPYHGEEGLRYKQVKMCIRDSGMVVVEELEHALARGAHIYAEIVGYGATSDGADMVAPVSYTHLAAFLAASAAASRSLPTSR